MVIKFREKKKKKVYNEWYKLEIDKPITIKCEDEFYFGRCVQFILDSNNKINIIDLFNEGYDVIGEAHEMKTLMLRPKEGDELSVDGCDDCNTWCVGDRRCECGNRRCSLAHQDATSLDDTSVYAYAECY